MTDTREKLLEAKYFLERMIEKQSERDAFQYNLSAFLAAGRSITLIMQTEFGKVPGFKKWYPDKQTKMQDDPEMKLLNEKRRITIHTNPVQPSAHVNVTLGGQIKPSGSLSVVIIRNDETVERRESKPEPVSASPDANVTTEWRWYFKEFPDKDVVTICKEHVGKLETLVEECESKCSLQDNT